MSSPELVNVEVDGRKVQVAKGSMIIQASDAAGIGVPRFCYHKKLSIAANCRMCLVDVEKMPKPAPACATPVMEGMVVRTQSARALSAQRNVMEFLLVNHPLDCPICDQGGECELQDLAMGYGRSVSRFVERKRTVADEDFGTLVASDMTRCIQCTRCVRFMDEIAGTQELGGMSRGEHLEIGTFTGKPLASELSGNVIDVCPVGALTNKVFRYRARPWELIAHESIGYHDSLHSNLWLHSRRGEILRTVPRDNEAINECWLSDRDRYSHQGLCHVDRLLKPRLKKAGVWQDVEWDEALEVVAAALSQSGADVGAAISPMTNCEDAYALKELLRALGSERLEHRMRSLDVAGSQPGLGAPLAALEAAGSILLVGSNPRWDQPLLAHRIRKAAKRGARVSALNPVEFELNFEVSQKFIETPAEFPLRLAEIARAVAELAGATVPSEWIELFASVQPGEIARTIARDFTERSPSRIIVGDFVQQHAQASLLRRLARFIADSASGQCDELGDGGNTVGLSRIGFSHPAGPSAVLGAGTLMLQGIEAADCADAKQFIHSMRAATSVVALVAFTSKELLEHADVLLPLALPPECAGTFVNIEGLQQECAGSGKPQGESMPAWRVYKAVSEKLEAGNGGFEDLAGLRDAMATDLQRRLRVEAATPVRTEKVEAQPGTGLQLTVLVAPYAADPVLRRSVALAGSTIGIAARRLLMHPGDAVDLQLPSGSTAEIAGCELEVEISARVPRGSCVAYAGIGNLLPLTGQRVQPIQGKTRD